MRVFKLIHLLRMVNRHKFELKHKLVVLRDHHLLFSSTNESNVEETKIEFGFFFNPLT